MIKYMVVTFDDVKNFQKFSYVDNDGFDVKAIKIPVINTKKDGYNTETKRSNAYILRCLDIIGTLEQNGYTFIEDDTPCRIEGCDLNMGE